MFEKAEIGQAVRSMYRTLQNRLLNTYDINDVDESYKIADSLLDIHGMSKEKFSIINQVEQFLVSKVNDLSIDDNSNKNENTIKGVLKESESPVDKIVGYRFLYRKLVQLYGKKEAKRLSSLLYDYTLALSDSTNILIPYCWAFDASKIVIMGKPFGQLPSKPVKRVDSYISLLNEIIHQMSNHLAGAIAIGTFFLDIAHLFLLKEDKKIEDLKDINFRNYVTNQYQRFIHGVNSLSRSGGTESPFTNISLFDKVKLNQIVEEYKWYFLNKDFEEVYTKYYIVEFIVELQNIFMEFFDKGDPANDGLPYRFPIATLNISKKKNAKNEWEIEDKVFLKSSCKKDIYRYNVFVSEGNKVASCCRLINNREMIELASQANSFGAGGSISLGSHRVLTINMARLALLAKDGQNFYELFSSAITDSKKVLFGHKELLKELKDVQIFLKKGWINIDRLFSTVGILGYVEAEEILKSKNFFNKNCDLLHDMMVFLNENLNSDNEIYPGCIFNIEQIPAESMSHRLPEADKLLFNLEDYYEIYSNQFIPLWDTTSTIWERIEKDGKYNQLLTGGGIVHINTGEHITGKQAESIINYAIKSGCEHFAITGTFLKCEDGHVTLGNRDLCPKCGKQIVTKIARIVGYFSPVEDWGSVKRNFDFKKRHEYINSDFNK